MAQKKKHPKKKLQLKHLAYILFLIFVSLVIWLITAIGYIKGSGLDDVWLYLTNRTAFEEERQNAHMQAVLAAVDLYYSEHAQQFPANNQEFLNYLRVGARHDPTRRSIYSEVKHAMLEYNVVIMRNPDGTSYSVSYTTAGGERKTIQARYHDEPFVQGI